MKWLFILLFIPFVSAQVVIQQVLYDPVGSESGGEAVELKNFGDSPVDISGWVIATESSASDATLPDGSVISAGGVFLVADKGWSEKRDDLDWRLADLEEPITLGNSDGSVALFDGESVVDAVAWGVVEELESGLFEGSPASPVASGRVLLRLDDSNDNSVDFVESLADFGAGIGVPVTADVSVSFSAVVISKSLKLAPEGILSVKNNGASSVSVRLFFNDFQFKNNTIPKSAVSLDGSSEFVVEPFSEYKAKVRLRIPSSVVPGTYTSTLRVIVS